MKPLFRLYLVAILIAGILCVVFSLSVLEQQAPYFSWQSLALFLSIGFLLNMARGLPGTQPRRAIAFLAPNLFFGPVITTLFVAAASLLQWAFDLLHHALSSQDKKVQDSSGQSIGSIHHLLATAQGVIAITFSGYLYIALGGQVGQIDMTSDLVCAIAAAACLILTEVLLGETATALERGRPIAAAWRNGLLGAVPLEGALAGLGLLLLLLYQSQQRNMLLFGISGEARRPLGIIFVAFIVLVPCWLLYYSYRLYLDMRFAYERTLRTLSGLVEARLASPSKPLTKEEVAKPQEKYRMIAELAVEMAEQMGLPLVEIEQVRFAAYLLEVGKMGLPRELIAKSNFASTKQRRAFARHVELASQILEPVEFLQPVAKLIRHHQERYDGLGYPAGLQGDQIPLGSRILAVAQAYAEMVAGTEGGSALGEAAALSHIAAGQRIRFDPKMVDVLATVLANRGVIKLHEKGEAAAIRVSPSVESHP